MFHADLLSSIYHFMINLRENQVLPLKKSILLYLTLLISSLTWGQSGIRDSSIRFSMIGVAYGIYLPGGDLEDRFGINSMVSLEYRYKLNSNFFFGVNTGFLFGDNVEAEGLFEGLSTSNGEIIGLDGLYAEVRVFERGYHVSAQFGKIFSVGRPNPNSGILVSAGPGFIQHKIRIEAIGNTVPGLRDDYLKGYDRLTNGFELNEFVGFILFGNKQLMNIYAGFEFIQAFTQNRRDHNFNAPEEDGAKKTDLMYGFRLGWVLPLYKKKPAPFYYN